MTDTSTKTRESRPTPAIDALLRRVRGRLLREVWLFGVGRALFSLSLWVLFIFLVDWVLHVPAPVRLVHLAILGGLPAFMLWRELIQRLRNIPREDGLAVLVERAHPELHELLVSAVQLRAGGSIDQSSDPALIDKVVAEADALAADLDLSRLSDRTPPRASMVLGVLATLATLITLTVQEDAARIFFARLAGGSTPWPQKTHLVLEIPLAGELHTTRDSLELSVARGSDLAIVVRSEGRVPDEVLVHFEGGQQTLLGSAGRGVFRTLLRSLQEDFALHVTGGDDTDGTPSLRIHVLQPPDVSAIAVRIEPPAYSGLGKRLEFDRDVQVLANSKLTVYMRPDPANATGVARLLPEDRTLELYRTPFPTPGGAEDPTDNSGLAFELSVAESLRYRFEIQDETGLMNPDPGLFAIHVELDSPPAINILAPARGEVESVVGGALPLKVLASDDFGLAEIAWRSVTAENPESVFQALVSTTPSDPSQLAPTKGKRAKQYATQRIEVDALFGTRTPSQGEIFQIEVRARDNREPSAQESRSSAVRLRIVSTDEFLRHIQDRLARVRGRVETLATLMGDKQGFTLDLIASLESDEPARADASSIQSALGAARRIEGDSKALSRELASIAEALLWSRVDDRANVILAELERRILPVADRKFHAQPWLELVELQRQDRLGDAGFADKVVEIVGACLDISEGDAAEAVQDLRRALDLQDLTAQYDTLVTASERQSSARAKTEQLLALLSEWDSYQSVLSAARDLANRQKNMLDRTLQYSKDH